MHRQLPPGEKNGHDKFELGDEVRVSFTGKVCRREYNTVTIRLKDKYSKSGYRQIQMPVDLVEKINILDKLAEIPGGEHHE